MNSKYIYTTYIKKLTPVDDFDMEKFILEVKKRDCIWNVNSKSYNLKCVRNRETKRQAWEDIAKIFYSNWDSLTPEDRQKKVEGLAKKWANIRKYYTEEVRKPVNSPPKKRQRRYHHLLTFLDDSVQKRRVPRIKEFKDISKQEVTVDNSSDSEGGELYIVEDLDETKEVSPERGNSAVAPALVDIKNDNPDPHTEVKREPDNNSFGLWETAVITPITENENSNTEIVKKNPEIMKLLKESKGPPPINDNFLYLPMSRPGDDSLLSKSLTIDQTAEASKKFLLSLLPEVMSLNLRQNMQFRLGIMDLLNDIKLKVEPKVDPKSFPDININ